MRRHQLLPELIDDYGERHEKQVLGTRLSECFLQPGEYPVHAHPHDGLAFILGGGLEELHDGVWHRFAAGDVLRQFRDRPHALRVGPEGTHVFRIRLRAEADLPQTGMLSCSPALLPVMQVLYRHFHDERGGGLALSAWCVDIELKLKGPGRGGRRQSPPGWLRDVPALLAESGQSTDLGVLCQQLGVGATRLGELFRRTYGCNPAEWWRRRRVFASCAPLRTTNRSLAGLAAEFGFSDQAHFCRQFKRVLGMTPGAYRRLG